MENIAKAEAIEESVSWGLVGAVIACVSIFGLTLGLSYPLLALILENQGIPKSLIGINAAMMPVGIIVSAPFVPKLARRTGAGRFAIVCLLSTAVLFGLLGASRRVEHWFFMRFVLGMAINGMFVVSETWINQLATRTTRGRIMGLYVTVMSVGFCTGPFLLPFTGVEGWSPFIAGIASPILAAVILFGLRNKLPVFKGKRHGSIARFLPLAPLLLLAVIATSLLDQAVLSFLPLYAMHYGLSQATGSFALGVLISGNVFLQIPLGWLADRVSRRRVMLMCALITVAGCSLLPLVIRHLPLLLPLLFFSGGAGFGSYTMALAELGDRFSGNMLLAGNAAFALMWGVGGIIGPAVTGSVMQRWGTQTLPWAMIVPFALFAVLLMLKRRQEPG